MKKVILGSTNIEVTELCFGALPIGPLQKNVDVNTASDIIAHALKSGINYIDTAKMYGTYEHIRLAIIKSEIRPVISSKSASADYDGMMRDVRAAADAMGVDCVDIFFLHAARANENVFTERAGAIKALLECKEQGLIKALGISTHDVKVTALAAKLPEIDIVFPIINKIGRGILSGTTEEMAEAIENCYAASKGVVLMKALGGGTLVNDFENSMDYVLQTSQARASIALGMVSIPEVNMNIKYFSGQGVSEPVSTDRKPAKQFFVLNAVCAKCGKCAEACHSDAIALSGEKYIIDSEKCLACGYCVAVCKQFAIRVV